MEERLASLSPKEKNAIINDTKKCFTQVFKMLRDVYVNIRQGYRELKEGGDALTPKQREAALILLEKNEFVASLAPEDDNWMMTKKLGALCLNINARVNSIKD